MSDRGAVSDTCMCNNHARARTPRSGCELPKGRAIEWSDGHYGATNGTVAGVRLFTYSLDSMRPEGEGTGKPYTLTSHLPGGKRYRLADIERCRLYASALLEQFISRVSA